jgi:hypothetical protein
MSRLDDKYLRIFLYDKGSDGTSDKDLMDEVYEHLHLGEDAIACRDKVDVSSPTSKVCFMLTLE